MFPFSNRDATLLAMEKAPESKEGSPARVAVLLLLFWAISAGLICWCRWRPDWGLWAFALYFSSVILCVLLSFVAAVPTIPRSRKPFMQALWYTVLVGMLPALVAFLLLRRLEEMDEDVMDFFENVALCLTAISLLALWIGGTDVVGIWGLQPLATAGIMSWAPVVYLQSTILWIVVVYNLTHFIGSVDLSVEMDLPFPLQVTYLVLVTLWFSSFLRVLCTRPGKPKDFESEMLSPKPRPNNQVFCVFCQSQKPQRCRHCTKCGACVLRMDHHCPWLRQCIGFGNYKYFVAFITYSAVALLFKAVTLMLFTVRAFHGEITFWTKLWLVSTEALVIALAGTMTAFAAFHLYLCAIGMTTIEFLTRNEKKEKYEKKVSFDQGLCGNLQAALGSIPLFWLFPACPPSGDGRTFPHKVLPHDVDKRTKESQRALAISEETALKEKEASNRPTQPCLESTAEPTCLEHQQDGCVAAEKEGEDPV